MWDNLIFRNFFLKTLVVCIFVFEIFMITYLVCKPNPAFYQTERMIPYRPEENFAREFTEDMKYILIWNPKGKTMVYLKDSGQTLFIKNECKFTNCFITQNRTYLDDIRDFDAILFSTDLLKETIYPSKRSAKQKYILGSSEPSPHLYNGVPNPLFDNYFNWTWTYRLSSDILWRYVGIYDSDGNQVGPKKSMKWLKYFRPTSEVVKAKLRRKTKAVAWIVSNCWSFTDRHKYVHELNRNLNKYNLTVDIYGECGKKCESDEECHRMIERDYYFYLSFEDSYDEDYVTENVLTATQHLAVPVVLGGADYSRFLPPGSYLNAKKHNPAEMALIMKYIISNFTILQNLFRWTNHYTYKSTFKPDICNLCTALNTETMMATETVHKHLRDWWNRDRQMEYNYLIQEGFYYLVYPDIGPVHMMDRTYFYPKIWRKRLGEALAR